MRLYDLIQREMVDGENYFLGKILTIIDASIPDAERRKGLKDLIKNARYEHPNWRLRRVAEIINQFGEKYSKVAASEEESYFLKKGEWPRDKEMAPPSNENYFPED